MNNILETDGICIYIYIENNRLDILLRSTTYYYHLQRPFNINISHELYIISMVRKF